MRNALSILKEAAKDFGEDKAPRLGAALAYYTLFSIAPLLLIAIAMAGFVFGDEAARGEIFAQMRGLIGAQGAGALQEMVAGAAKPKEGMLATIGGLFMLIFGASGVFGQLKEALNTIWEVPPKKAGGIAAAIRERFLSVAMVLGVGFLLLVSLIIDAAISAFGDLVGPILPGGEAIAHTFHLAVSLSVVTFLFAMIFRYLPDLRIPWRDVWFGAAFTSVLFVAGKFVLGLYLGKKAADSTYGAAGALVVLLLWVYYSAQILFFGAEVTQVYARRHGSMRVEKRAEACEPERPARTMAVRVAQPACRGGWIKVLAGSAVGLFAGALIGALSSVVLAVRTVKRLLP